MITRARERCAVLDVRMGAFPAPEQQEQKPAVYYGGFGKIDQFTKPAGASTRAPPGFGVRQSSAALDSSL